MLHYPLSQYLQTSLFNKKVPKCYQKSAHQNGKTPDSMTFLLISKNKNEIITICAQNVYKALTDSSSNTDLE